MTALTVITHKGKRHRWYPSAIFMNKTVGWTCQLCAKVKWTKSYLNKRKFGEL